MLNNRLPAWHGWLICLLLGSSTILLLAYMSRQWSTVNYQRQIIQTGMVMTWAFRYSTIKVEAIFLKQLIQFYLKDLYNCKVFRAFAISLSCFRLAQVKEITLKWSSDLCYRLGLYLFTRIMKEGHDRRFNGVREKPMKFLFFWTIQG